MKGNVFDSAVRPLAMHKRLYLKAALRSAAAALINLGLTLPGAAAEGPSNRCVQANPAVAGQCYLVQGTASPSADVGMVLGVQGERTIVLWPPPGSNVYAPPEVEGPLDTMRVGVTGRFLVCPLPEQPNQFDRGFLRYGCISQAYDLRVTSGP